jgi:acetyl esterase
MEYFFRQYPRTSEDLHDPYLLPLAATDLSGLAPALVMTAECEVLRDEGEEYARRLSEAGTPCELVRYDGQIHGFFGLLDEHMEISPAAQDAAVRALRGAFEGATEVAVGRH